MSGTMKATQLQASIESFTQYIKDHFGNRAVDLPEVFYFNDHLLWVPLGITVLYDLTLLHSERPKLHTILASLSAVGLKKLYSFKEVAF